jgi:hypothetical protein
MIKSGFSG